MEENNENQTVIANEGINPILEITQEEIETAIDTTDAVQNSEISNIDVKEVADEISENETEISNGEIVNSEVSKYEIETNTTSTGADMPQRMTSNEANEATIEVDSQQNITEIKVDDVLVAENEPVLNAQNSETIEKPSKLKTVKKKAVEEDGEKIIAESNSIEPVNVLEALENETVEHDVDYANLSKAELIEILEKSFANIKLEGVANSDIKKADSVLKAINPSFQQIKSKERADALQKYIQENENEEGFDFKPDALSIRYDELYKGIKGIKQQYFGDQEKQKDKNFSTKTDLLNQLRALADSEDGNLSAVKANIVTIKKIQQEWKDAGNIASPHNNTLWQTYHALVDRFYSNRSIYFELLELDRKKNLNLKVDLCTKVEALAESLQSAEITSKHINDANHLFEEFKHVGPASKEANELLWQRFKGALDILYDKRREQLDSQKGAFEENYLAKQKVVESLSLFTSFKSESINEWSEQTKAIDILQKQWNDVKGPMPKDKGRDLSKDFWNGVKTFYRNKGEFFKTLEAKRDENLKLKQDLCEQAEAYLASEEDSAAITQAVIKLQEDWRKVGHVPDKFRNKIYDRFKAACDGYFNKKRSKSNESDKVFQENLIKKQALCERIEKDALKNADMENLSEIKAEWAAIGFVPKPEMQAIQKRYINAINSYVGSMGKLSYKDKEKLTLQTEVELFKQKDRGNNNVKDLGRKESDIRAKIQNLENDLSTLKNNLEFFAKSKNAEKLKADFEQKIKKGEDDLTHMKHQLKVLRQAAD
jgi:Domain of Unknown Function (DUF349)